MPFYYSVGGIVLCLDIDECALLTHDCEQVCTNKVDNYTCSCVSNNTLNESTRLCEQGMYTLHGCTAKQKTLKTCGDSMNVQIVDALKLFL